MEELIKSYDNPTSILSWFSHYSLGNRIQKTSGSTVTKYIVDPNRLLPSVLAETNNSGAITAYYVYGLGLISKIQGSNAYFYQYDGLGSTVAITDKNGSIKNKYAYDDFGNLATNSTEAIANPFKYVGRFGVMTDLPDLLYMRARYYSPSVGRFINKDPIGLQRGSNLNLYRYVNNNPINNVDPSGEIMNPIVVAIVAGIVVTVIIITEIVRAIRGSEGLPGTAGPAEDPTAVPKPQYQGRCPIIR